MFSLKVYQTILNRKMSVSQTLAQFLHFSKPPSVAPVTGRESEWEKQRNSEKLRVPHKNLLRTHFPVLYLYICRERAGRFMEDQRDMVVQKHRGEGGLTAWLGWGRCFARHLLVVC